MSADPPVRAAVVCLRPYRPCPRCRRSNGVWQRRAWRCYHCYARLEPVA